MGRDHFNAALRFCVDRAANEQTIAGAMKAAFALCRRLSTLYPNEHNGQACAETPVDIVVRE
jgi:hypothetical protein